MNRLNKQSNDLKSRDLNSSNIDAQDLEYRVFLVRAWREPEEPVASIAWRFVLEEKATRLHQGCSTLELLYSALHATLQPNIGAADTDATSTTD